MNKTRSATLMTAADIEKAIAMRQEIDVALTAAELIPLSGLEKFIACSFTLESAAGGSRLPNIVQMTVVLECLIIDNVTFKTVREIFVDADDLIFESDRTDEVVEMEGQYYNLRPPFLAILYSLIPFSYTKEECFVSQTINGFEVMTASEYQQKKAAKARDNSPFADIDIEDGTAEES